MVSERVHSLPKNPNPRSSTSPPSPPNPSLHHVSDKLKELEEKLQAHVVELDIDEAHLNGKATALSDTAAITPTPPAPIASSTYVGNIKTLVPITFDL
jgi:hypothetical protein